MLKTIAIFILLAVFCEGCSSSEFFQKTALTRPSEIAEIETGHLPDSVTVTVGRQYDKSKFHTLIFGEHYRKLWSTPVRVPVFNVRKEFGGLKPVSLGGGFQTTSLALRDRNGRLYVLRSLDKNPQRSLPKSLRKTFLMNILRDQTSATNPFAPLVLPCLSEAAGIYYASPKLVYVAPNDSSLEKFLWKIQDKVFLLEEKFEGKKSLTSSFGNALTLISSDSMLHKRFQDNRNQIDQQLFARSRLFDVLIGDWDRHKDQWAWAVYKNRSTYIYKPIPKDRDQAFYRFDDGLITWVASNRFILKKFQPYSDSYVYVPGLLINARFIDERALNSITLEDWLRHANELKNALTDTVILQAFTSLPPPIYDRSGPVTMSRLKSRRDKLPEAATKIYKILAKNVTVAGTDSRERFKVERLPTGKTLVEVFRYDTTETVPFYSRIFNPSETKTITLHGLGNDDIFRISGEARHAIQLKIYGGEGEDQVSNTSKIRSWGKTITVYDTKRGMELSTTSGIIKKFKRNESVNAYDREGI